MDLKFQVTTTVLILLCSLVYAQDNSVVIDGREYIVHHVESSNISCTIKRVEGASSEILKVKVIAFYIPKKTAALDKKRITDQWYGDDVYFLGLTSKPYNDIFKDPATGTLRGLPRNSIFLPINDQPNIYTIQKWDW